MAGMTEELNLIFLICFNLIQSMPIISIKLKFK